MGGFQKSFIQVCLVVFMVSLPFGKAKAIAEGPEEVSSPEELKPKSLPGLRALPKEVWPTVIPMQEYEGNSQAQGISGIAPGISPGISPYQINPITAMMTAAVVLAVQSVREQGHIDQKALWRVFNSTDFYVGVLGSFLAARGKDEVVKIGSGVLSRVIPGAFADFGKNQSLRIFGNIVNGISYMVAVSAGFEYFSQYWKLATRNVPNVTRVSDLANASSTDVIRVLNNLLQYLANADLQKRILSSIKYHRVYTFEFIAMNVGVFVGIFLGDLIAQRMGPKATEATKLNWSQWLTRELSRFLGGVIGGVAIQFIPEGFKVRVNASLMDWKIAGVRKDLSQLVSNIDAGIRYKYYPPRHSPSVASFWSSQVNLQSDVRRLIRTRDLLYSLYANRYFLVGVDDHFANEIDAENANLNSRLEEWVQEAGGIGPSSSGSALDIGMQAFSMEELETWIYQDMNKDEYQKHYTRVLYAGWQNLNSSYDDFNEFMTSLDEFKASEGEEVLRDLQTMSPLTP